MSNSVTPYHTVLAPAASAATAARWAEQNNHKV